MHIKDIKDEDFLNYKKAAMFIITPWCDGKCYRELNLDASICQNHELVNLPVPKVDDDAIVERYLNNPNTESFVLGGLEPLMAQEEIIAFIDCVRRKHNCPDDIVIYTGYTPDEVKNFMKEAGRYAHIYMKFGRYIPNSSSKEDPVLGVTLASSNQFGALISMV